MSENCSAAITHMLLPVLARGIMRPDLTLYCHLVPGANEGAKVDLEKAFALLCPIKYQPPYPMPH
eukprot:3810132-Rhodomonas_salina.4